MVEAYNGVEALAYYEKLEQGAVSLENLPEVVLLDLNMHVMDGWDFFETFKKRFPKYFSQTKIFILSSSINPLMKPELKKKRIL
ncbi:response regulator transcription factor [Flavobacterium aciduliphilum]|uniref:Response regulator receiver domain-containing protein n=1 Tax=Flavobacterium aciduliphilum TaxID=1101402 RepID=A0A328YXY8_9FLAO|nr:response regulator [Flavobacterium aciduliphilum]RAR75407.1 response regulator receiver domain-containing protein [Flavobacterium aciduliphilum]